MKNRIQILSRDAAEALIDAGFPQNAAVIGISDPKTRRTPPDYAPIDYSGVCKRVFPLAVHDISFDILDDFGLTLDTYFPEADALAGFIREAVRDDCEIICQCEYGQSRSAGCAAAILEYFNGTGISIFSDYRYYPNQLIFNKLLSALRSNGNAE